MPEKYLKHFCLKLIAESNEMDLSQDDSWTRLLSHADAIYRAFTGDAYVVKNASYALTPAFRAYAEKRVLATLEYIQKGYREESSTIRKEERTSCIS